MKNRGDIIQCYNIFVETNPEVAEGNLKVDFEIDDNGKVIKAEKVFGHFMDDQFIGCITGKLKSWEFPRPDIPSPVYAVHTFTFKKSENKQQ